MREDNVKRLLEAAKTGTLEDVQAAFGACNVDEREKGGFWTLRYAVKNHSPYALDIVKFLMREKTNSNYSILYNAVRNTGPCALEIVRFMMKRGANPHKKNWYGETAFTASLLNGSPTIADYLLSRDDFLPSDLMPQPERLPVDTYEKYREKAISRVSELIDSEGLPYAQAVAVDIEKIMKTEKPKPTEEDIEALQPLVRKMSSRDWVADTKVSSDDFMDCDITR